MASPSPDGLVHAHVAHLIALAVDHRDVIGRLEHLHQEIPKHVWHAARPALIAGRRIALAGERYIAVLLDHFGRLGLQNRIGVIADQRLEIGHAIATARAVRHRAGTRCRRLEAGEEGMGPDAGEIRMAPGVAVVGAGAGDTVCAKAVVESV